MFSNVDFKKWGFVSIAFLLFGLMAIFAFNRISSKKCTDIVLNLKTNPQNQYIVTKDEIKALVTQNNTATPLGQYFSRVDLYKIEKQILVNGLVKKCQVFTDLEGNLQVMVEVHQPIARIISSSNAYNAYVNEEGAVLPVSNQYSMRLLVLSGAYFDEPKNRKKPLEKAYLDLILTLNKDDFWSKQIAQIDIEADGNMLMVPLIGNHVVEFGTPIHSKEKLQKLELFYRTILSTKGYDTFQKVSVKFANQIICK